MEVKEKLTFAEHAREMVAQLSSWRALSFKTIWDRHIWSSCNHCGRLLSYKQIHQIIGGCGDVAAMSTGLCQTALLLQKDGVERWQPSRTYCYMWSYSWRSSRWQNWNCFVDAIDLHIRNVRGSQLNNATGRIIVLAEDFGSLFSSVNMISNVVRWNKIGDASFKRMQHVLKLTSCFCPNTDPRILMPWPVPQIFESHWSSVKLHVYTSFCQRRCMKTWDNSAGFAYNLALRAPIHNLNTNPFIISARIHWVVRCSIQLDFWEGDE